MTEKRSRLRGRFYFDPIIFGVGGFPEKVINAFLFIFRISDSEHFCVLYL